MKTYIIKKGRHYSKHLPKLCYNRKELGAKVMFHSNCWFPLKNLDDYAINKLVGWSNGYHHNSSIRCGWRPAAIPGYIDLFFYIYNKGYRSDSFFATVECDKEFELSILYQGGYIVFGIGKNIVGLPVEYSGSKLGYILFPYVGGKLSARQDIHIDLEIK